MSNFEVMPTNFSQFRGSKEVLPKKPKISELRLLKERGADPHLEDIDLRKLTKEQLQWINDVYVLCEQVSVEKIFDLTEEEFVVLQNKLETIDVALRKYRKDVFHDAAVRKANAKTEGLELDENDVTHEQKMAVVGIVGSKLGGLYNLVDLRLEEERRNRESMPKAA